MSVFPVSLPRPGPGPGPGPVVSWLCFTELIMSRGHLSQVPGSHTQTPTTDQMDGVPLPDITWILYNISFPNIEFHEISLISLLWPGPADPRAKVPLPRAGQAAGNTGFSLVSPHEYWAVIGCRTTSTGWRSPSCSSATRSSTTTPPATSPEPPPRRSDSATDQRKYFWQHWNIFHEKLRQCSALRVSPDV